MRGARAVGAIAIVVTLGGLAAMLSCSAITGIAGYAVDCRGCVHARCAPQLAACEQHPDECGNAEGCFLGCIDRRLTLNACFAACTPPDTGLAQAPATVTDVIGCILTACPDLCFAPPTEEDSGPRADSASTDARSDVAPLEAGGDVDAIASDGGCVTPTRVTYADCTGALSGPMVQLANAPTPFCIDPREVTISQYDAFLADVASSGPPCGFAPCAGAPGYVPSWPEGAEPGDKLLPVHGIDSCDAAAYCAWAGKRLCGAIGGGASNDPESASDEWRFACGDGGAADAYPYDATTYSSSTCNTEKTSPPDDLVDVASFPDCHGLSAPYDAIFGMVGNVAEFTNSAGTDTTLRGGDALAKNTAKCTLAVPVGRAAVEPSGGIRCCAGP